MSFCFNNFLIRVPTSGILFLISLRAVVIGKSLILVISPLTSLIIALREVVVAKLGILSFIFHVYDFSIIIRFFFCFFVFVIFFFCCCCLFDKPTIINGINFFNQLLYSFFVTALFFTTSLSLLKSVRVISNLPITNSSTLLFKLLLNHVVVLINN